MEKKGRGFMGLKSWERLDGLIHCVDPPGCGIIHMVMLVE